jgi:hypothetical protein
VLCVGCLALGVNFTLLRVGGDSNGDLIVVCCSVSDSGNIVSTRIEQ